MELGLRVQRLLPLHDTGPAEEAVRGRLAEMRASLAGTPADAAVHDALGRGLAALGDHRAARADMERALELGSDDPQLHFVLGHTLLRLHDAALEDARRTGGSSFVAARKAALGAEYLPLARHHLDRSRGARIASPRYLEALLAYQSGDLERSLGEAREAAREEPAFYEAHALAARVLEEQGQAAADRGDAAAADAAFLEAIAELETGARFGRSDAALYDALVEIWSRRLDLGQHEPDAGLRLAQLAGALLASDRLLAAAPRRTGAYGRRAHIFFLGQTGQTGNDALLAPLVERCTQAARTALELDPTDVFALQMRGDCTMDRALALDLPLPALAGSVADFTEVLRLAPGSPWAANDLCLALTSFAELTWIAGRDAVPTAERAIANCLLATRLDPAYANPWLNITFTYGVLAAAASEGGPWDAASAAKGREAARRSYGMHPAGPVVSRVNLLALATFELEHARASGADSSAALRHAQDAIADLEAVTPVEWLRQGEIALVLLEARAAVAVASGDDAAPPIRRCLELDPVRFACRMLAYRAAPTVAAARRLVTDWPLSARTWVALADVQLRLGHRADAVAAAATATALAPSFAAARAMLTRAAAGTR